jgi:quinol monooxygenase YgiN
MYTATMIYPVNNESMEDFIRIWEEKILQSCHRPGGFVRMQLLTRENEALAIGTWTEKAHAEAFMKLGPFKNLMESVSEMLTGEPRPTIWTQSAYASR